MMGRSHALFSLAGGLSLAGLVSDKLGHPMGAAAVASAAFVAGGAALLPDLDHHEATISEVFGPISKAVSRVVILLFGKHRSGTHSAFLQFPIIVGLLTWWFVRLRTGGLEASIIGHEHGGIAGVGLHLVAWLVTLGPAGFTVWLCYGLFLWAAGPRDLRRKGRIAVALVSLGATVLTMHYVVLGPWLAVAVGAGCFQHLAADFLTDQGLPLVPFFRKNDSGHYRTVKFAIIRHTGQGMIEPLVIYGSLVASVFFFLQDFGAVLHLPHLAHVTV